MDCDKQVYDFLLEKDYEIKSLFVLYQNINNIKLIFLFKNDDDLFEFIQLVETQLNHNIAIIKDNEVNIYPEQNKIVIVLGIDTIQKYPNKIDNMSIIIGESYFDSTIINNLPIKLKKLIIITLTQVEIKNLPNNLNELCLFGIGNKFNLDYLPESLKIFKMLYGEKTTHYYKNDFVNLPRNLKIIIISTKMDFVKIGDIIIFFENIFIDDKKFMKDKILFNSVDEFINKGPFLKECNECLELGLIPYNSV